MSKSLFLGLALAVILCSLAAYFYLDDPELKSSRQLQLVLGDGDFKEFEKVLKPQPINFPKDHGPHSNYKTEWWYFTGNLENKSGEKFGYQLTFFRFGLSPGELKSETAWVSNQIYMAHFALSARRFYQFERFNRTGLELAGAQSSPFKVWLDDWRIEQISSMQKQNCRGCLSLSLSAAHDNVKIDLELTSLKPAILQGDQGFSQKSNQPGNASMYYSLTRMETEGKVTIGQKQYSVEGLSWMDREWSTSALSEQQTGWDWFSIHLDDGTDLMYYQLRLRDGLIDANSSGSIIDVAGVKTHLQSDDVKLFVKDHWRSPHSKVTYPSSWHLVIPGENLDLQIQPLLNDQELNLAFRYWEGAVNISGVKSGVKVNGKGFVELTGY